MTTYYVSAAGNNSNNGTTTGTSWADFTNVNTTAFRGGDSVLVNGGDTISGAIALDPSNWGGTNQWNASHKDATITLSGKTNNLLTATLASGGGTDHTFFSTLSQSSGKWVFSTVLTTAVGSQVVGVGTASASTVAGNYLGFDTNSVGIVTAGASVGKVFLNGNSVPAIGTYSMTACVSGDRIWVAVDIGAKTIQFAKNNTAWSSAFDISTLAGFTLFPGGDLGTVSDVQTADFNTNPPTGITGFSIWNGSNPSPSSQVTFDSYGTGVGTLSTGSATWGFEAISIANFTVQNLVFTGPNQTTNKTGILIYNNIQQDHHLPAFTLSNLTVSTYGSSGIELFGNITGSGFDNVTVKNCTVHHCGGGVNGASGGILFFGLTLGTGWTEPAFTNALITNCVVHDMGLVGTAFATAAPSGIALGQGLNCTIQYCEVYNTGIGCTSVGQPNGIWTYDSIGNVLQFNESYSNVGGGGATWSAAGIDLDVHCQNCIAQYNYSHDNDGPGLMVIAFSEAGYTNNLNSVVRYNITQNNGKSASDNGVGGEIALINGHGSTTSVLTGLQIFNNTCYSSAAAAVGCVLCVGADFSGTTGHVANNIFYTTGAKFVNFIASATATSGSAFLFSGNDYHTTGSFSLTWGATTYTSFANWVAAVTAQEPIAQRLSSPTGDPSLTSAGGGGTTHGYNPTSLSAYTLSGGSAMIGVGLNLSSLYSISPGSQDYYGNSLPGATGTGFNVGADGEVAVGSRGGLLLLGGSIGFPQLLGLGAVWKAAKAIQRNATMTRRKLMFWGRIGLLLLLISAATIAYANRGGVQAPQAIGANCLLISSGTTKCLLVSSGTTNTLLVHQ